MFRGALNAIIPHTPTRCDARKRGAARRLTLVLPLLLVDCFTHGRGLARHHSGLLAGQVTVQLRCSSIPCMTNVAMAALDLDAVYAPKVSTFT
jgi:hypothetical protein